MNTTGRSTPDLQTLLNLFYPDTGQLGQFQEVTSSQLPAHYAALLDHNEHMTVTVEEFHQSLVDVHVLATQVDETHYARKILLSRHPTERSFNLELSASVLTISIPTYKQKLSNKRRLWGAS